MAKTKIEWTDLTWNPFIGCRKIGPGCDHCYAERMANRIAHMNTAAGEMYRGVVGLDGKWNGMTVLADTYFAFPEFYKKPKRIFVGSMTDIFLHSQSEQGFKEVVKLFVVMAYHNQHTFQILTKRPALMKIFIEKAKNEIMQTLFHETHNVLLPWSLPNVWLGVTVCNQAEANRKIPILLDIPAAIRFVSIEPMLGEIDLSRLLDNEWTTNALNGVSIHPAGKIIHNKLDWVICGGETGPGARQLYASWVALLADQCIKNKVPFFFKSAGSNPHSKREIAWRAAWVQTYKQLPDAKKI